jgi:hypothetical protein
MLGDLHNERLRADYRLDLNGPETARRARECVEIATEIQKLLAVCDSESIKSTMLADIRAYQHRLGGGGS